MQWLSAQSECGGSGAHASLFGRAECFKLFLQRVASSSSASASPFPARAPSRVCQKAMQVKVSALITSQK